MDNPMEKQAKDLSNILGFGVKMKVLWGIKENPDKQGEQIEDIRDIHLTPCSLKDLPNMFSKLNNFFDGSAANPMAWTQDQINEVADIIYLSTRKMHPDLDKSAILEKFGLGGLAKAIRIAMDINDFLSEVTAMNKQMAEAATSLPALKK